MQHDMTIDNQGFGATRADINAALQALVSNNSGATEPTTTFAYQWWADTTAGILKQRNAANSAWISVLTLATGVPLGAAASGANNDITALLNSGGIRFATRADVASAATVSLTGNPDDIRITGTTTITGFTAAAGRVVRVVFGGSLTLTNNANIVTPTGANIVTQAGDTCVLRATAANTVEVLSYAYSGIVPNASIGASKLSGAQSGSAPVYGARAWCKFNGTLAGTNAPIAGGNVTSVTRNSTGNYTVNLTTAMADSDYAYVGICPGNGPLLLVVPLSQANGSFTFNTQAPSTGAVIDVNPIFIAVFR